MNKQKQRNENSRIASAKNTDNLPMFEHRRFIRHPLSIPLTYKVFKKPQDMDKEFTSGVTSNISIGGLLFSTKRPVEIGSLIVIKMPFEDKVFNVK